MSFERSQPGGVPARFVALDGFRGILALCVAIYHTYWLSTINDTAFFNNGPVLIDLFFVFSGFLMFTLYGEQMRTGADAKMFLKRRIARLYPVHLAMTLVLMLYAIARLYAQKMGFGTIEVGEILPFSAGAPETVGSLISNLTLTQSLGVHDSLTYNVPAWTISVEAAAYLVFVTMCLLAPPKRAIHFLLIAIGVAAIYAGLAAVKPNMDITYDLGFWRCLAGFYVGILCAWMRPWVSRTFATISKSSATWIEVATALGFAAFVIWLPGKGQFLVGLFALIFVGVFAQDRGAVSDLLGHRIFKYLAKISYSVYMVHFIIALVFGVVANQILPESVMSSAWAGDALIALYVGVVIVGGHLLHILVEVPGARWMKARLRVRARAGLQAA